MREKTELLSSAESSEFERFSTHAGDATHHTRDLLEIALVFALILVAVWTPQGRVNSFFSIVAAVCVVSFAIAGRWSPREMGLTRGGDFRERLNENRIAKERRGAEGRISAGFVRQESVFDERRRAFVFGVRE